ncbi:MAG: polysaccharide pyruvyl transferase family protein [Rubrivivax sp.]
MLTAIRRHLRPAPAPRRYTEAYPRVQVFEWRPQGGAINFGDHLARVVVDRVLAGRGLTAQDETAAAATLFSVGSVLHFAQDGAVVWGAGINGKVALQEHRFRRLDVRAVRGPRTAEQLQRWGIAVPAVYGDPALLLPTLFADRFAPRPRRRAAFVPNLHDLEGLQSPVPVISPLWGWNRVVSEILGCELVLASSLHGLIVAESFGIPARYVRLSETENRFKYDDYAQGTGRPDLQPARSIAEGLAMGGLAPIVFDPQALLSAFPWDLWACT